VWVAGGAGSDARPDRHGRRGGYHKGMGTARKGAARDAFGHLA
jgi:hypothetical protein